MEVIFRPDAERAVDLVAALIPDRVLAGPDLVLGLATRRTLERVDDRLVDAGVSLKDCTSFYLAEYIGLSRGGTARWRSMDLELTRFRGRVAG